MVNKNHTKSTVKKNTSKKEVSKKKVIEEPIENKIKEDNSEIETWKIVKYLAGVIIAFILIILCLIYGPKSNRYEQKMTDLITKFYESNIKGKVSISSKHMITIEDLELIGKYDVDVLEDCDKSSYSYIIIKNPSETDLEKIEYSIENHLKCGK